MNLSSNNASLIAVVTYNPPMLGTIAGSIWAELFGLIMFMGDFITETKDLKNW